MSCKTAGSVKFVDSHGTSRDSGLCERNLNLLAHAQTIELDIGSRCGGHGVCGGDRVKILDDAAALSPLTEPERQHLSPDEIAQGWRLACQCFPDKSDQSLQLLVSDRI